MLLELSECAYRLGVAFGGEAERAEEAGRKLEYFRLFDRCFFAVRVATTLELRLRREPPMRPEAQEALAERDGPRDRDDTRESEGPENERPDWHERAGRGRDEPDRDREREAEPASLPVLLRTLDGVATDAAALPGAEPAALPTLRELLAHMASDPPPALAPPAPKAPTGLRARLAGSGAAQALRVLPPRPAARGGGLGVRHATGPPRR